VAEASIPAKAKAVSWRKGVLLVIVFSLCLFAGSSAREAGSPWKIKGPADLAVNQHLWNFEEFMPGFVAMRA
jgi:hypothetical protein